MAAGVFDQWARSMLVILVFLRRCEIAATLLLMPFFGPPLADPGVMLVITRRVVHREVIHDALAQFHVSRETCCFLPSRSRVVRSRPPYPWRHLRPGPQLRCVFRLRGTAPPSR
jgi:hypothetical protein